MAMNAGKADSDPAGPRIIQEAAAWDSQLRAPDCTNDDRARFSAWRDADPAHVVAFERLQLITATLRNNQGRADVRALRDEALRAIGAQRRRRLAWAAAVIVAVALPASLWMSHASGWFRQALDTALAGITGGENYATGLGQRSTFVLEDGSSVDLDARSKIVVSFAPAQRDVTLVQGQAIFNVAKNPLRPFVVHAGNREIIAVGTQFDVRLDPHSVQVTLIEGKVRVTSSRAASEMKAPAGDSPAGSGDILLTPGKQLTAKIHDASPPHGGDPGSRARTQSPTPVGQLDGTADGAPTGSPEAADVVRSIDVAKVTGWRDGRVFFEDLSLEDAVAEMNKYSSTQIEIGEPSLANLRVNGMFMAGGQEAFAIALEGYFALVAERHGDKVIVLMPRH